MNTSSSGFTFLFMPFLMIAGTALQLLGQLVLAWAFVVGYRRLKHWSFGVLAFYFFGSSVVTATTVVLFNTGHGVGGAGGVSFEAWSVFQYGWNTLGAVLLIAGSGGLLSAVRELFPSNHNDHSSIRPSCSSDQPSRP